MKKAAAVLALAVGLVAAGAGNAAKGWYWTPGLCKTNLIHRGVSLADGRSFRAVDVRCFGQPTCWIDDNVVRYDHFDVAMLDGNGAVRTHRVVVTGKSAASVSAVRVWPGVKWGDLEYFLGKQGIGPVSPTACHR